MRRLALNLFAVAGLAAPMAFAANAHAQQTNSCRNAAFATAFSKIPAGNGNFNYFVQVKNGTRQKIYFDLSFSGFPPGVNIFEHRLSSIAIDQNTTKTIQIGSGNNSTIENRDIQLTVDSNSSTGMSIAVRNCRK